MYSDPFYRQLVKVMQDNGKEVSSTRQSSRYKDDLQSTRNASANLSKQKLKKRFKVEIPANYSVAKITTMNRLIWNWKIQRVDRQLQVRESRAALLRERIQFLKNTKPAEEGEVKPEAVVDSS
jgi:hypothetical protein